MKTHTTHHRLAALCLAALLCLATALPAAASPAATRDAGPVSYLADWMQSIYATIVHVATFGSEQLDEPLSVEDETGPLIIGNGVTAEGEPDSGDESSGPLAIPNGLTSEDAESESSGTMIIPNG